MSLYDVHPIALCQGPRDSSHFAYRAEPGTVCNTACYVWYIKGPGLNILVDAGAEASIFTRRGTPETDLVSVEYGLSRFSLKPDDIDIVIMTHLHCDHVALAHLYKKAKFVVQKKELGYARNPHPIDAVLYDRSSLEGLNWEVIEGDRKIAPGISAVLTPGHTPGGQSIEVSTSSGTAVITGFCCTLATFNQTEEMKQRGWEVTTPLIHHDVCEAYNSVLKVKHRADIILALHDPKYIGIKRIP